MSDTRRTFNEFNGRCVTCDENEDNCRCDDEDFTDELDCSWCSGEGAFWGAELPGYDPGWHLPDEMYPCPSCKGTGNRRDQVLF